MSTERYRFCKVYVNRVDTDAAKALLATLLSGQFTRRSMFLGGLVVEVRGNPDAAASDDVGEDFVRWPTLVELDAEDDTGEQVMVDTTSRILRALWDASYPAVASCDFEDELPWAGGIRRLQSSS